MEKKLKIYLDTSVINFLFADDAPEKKETTHRFIEKIKQGEYEIFLSDVVIEEIGKAENKKKQLLLNIIKEYKPKRKIDH